MKLFFFELKKFLQNKITSRFELPSQDVSINFVRKEKRRFCYFWVLGLSVNAIN
jgi:hypothetical protein